MDAEFTESKTELNMGNTAVDNCLKLFNRFQELMQSHLLLKKNGFQTEQDQLPADASSLSTSDAVLYSPSAFICFSLICEEQQSDELLTSTVLTERINRHSGANAQATRRLLRMAVTQGLLSENTCEQDARIKTYHATPVLTQILSDCQHQDQHREPQAGQPQVKSGNDEKELRLDALQEQLAYAYRAYKADHSKIVISASTEALKVLRSMRANTNPRVLEQKALFLNLRADALRQLGQESASEACFKAATKCLAVINSKRLMAAK